MRNSPAVVILFLAVCVAPVHAGPPLEAVAAKPRIPVSREWLQGAERTIRESEYRFSRVDASHWSAVNPAHDLGSTVSLEGLTITPRTRGGSGWELGLRLVDAGRTAPDDQKSARISAGNNQVEIVRGRITEWIDNDAHGLRHGFVIASPIGDRSEQSFILELEIAGNVSARLSADRSEILFRSPDGRDVVRYWHARVEDAYGAQWPAHFRLDDRRIRIIVDDREAAYPLLFEPLASSPNWSAVGTQIDEEFGFGVSDAGDVNGDGFKDVIVGAYRFGTGTGNRGRAHVYYGSENGLALSPSWSAESMKEISDLGFAIASAGDVNGDGFDDVIIGDPDWDTDRDPVTDEGAAFVFYGSLTGLDPGTRPVGNPENADWSSIGDQVGGTFGQAVASAGDVNGDGYDDIIVSSDEYNAGELDEGRAYVFLGSETGLETTASWTAESDQDNSDFSFSVASAGDVNGDGYDDVIIGAHKYEDTEVDNNEGWAFVYHGSETGLADADDDGIARVSDAGWVGQIDVSNANFGWSVSTAGDVNGDGYDDVIVGADEIGPPLTSDGAAFVYLGSPSGLAPDFAWRVDSDQPDAFLGWSVSTAGDINDDGYGDVIVGTPDRTETFFIEGRALVYFGSAAGLCPSPSWIADGGQNNAEFGTSVSTAGDVNGDGFDDVIIGADEFSVEPFAAEGGAFVFHSCAARPPSGDTTIQWTATDMIWSAIPGAESYDVLQGDLLLLQSEGDLALSAQTCVADDTPGLSVAVGSPVPGMGWWFLVRGVSCGGGGTLGATRDPLVGGCVVCP